MNKLRTIRESTNAPGLPYFPRHETYNSGDSRLIEVVSVNYDYLPMNLESPKMFWIDLRFPAPEDLLVGSSVRLHMKPYQGIQTTLDVNSKYNSVFQVDDIVGSRIILSPYKGSAWLPTVHESCDNPFGWGYDMTQIDVKTSRHESKYGYGTSMTYLEYYPQFYSSRATRLEASRVEEDYYRGTKNVPGWQYS